MTILLLSPGISKAGKPQGFGDRVPNTYFYHLHSLKFKLCLIVPQRINMLFLHKPNKYGLPNGIHPKSGGKYYATYKHKNLGTFNTLDEAVYAHERAKKNAIIDVANEYKEMIPTKVYDALLAWNPF